ncbi:MAG: acetyl-coenzyme synthetase [Gemmatimonadetes bacterium]|jgi:acetyl-CoA synthetase|nr:acetyl-coenzyme synthetase [Gemmatimonadota bacterium]
MDLVHPMARETQREAREDPDAYWARAASDVEWFRPWHRVFRQEGVSFRWFEGGETNLCFNALDRHVRDGRGGHAALVYVNERGERLVLTYAQLLHHVERIAGALRTSGVGRGDRVTIYLPNSPEGVMAMLACARVGAIHCAVFAGFGAAALADRIRASGSRLVLTCDASFRKGKPIRLKEIVDAALLLGGDTVEQVVVLQRTDIPAPMTGGRDEDWRVWLAAGAEGDRRCERMEANEPAYILATSGTTARPKLVVHTHGGYQVGMIHAARWCFGMTRDDVWFTTADIGWAVGHSYLVYAPLILGCTTIAYEGALDHPSPAQVWQIVEEFRVTGLFTSPTAVRLLMRTGEAAAAPYDKSSLTRVVCAGEVLNAPAWEWLQKRALGDRIPVIDHWWQTETGGPTVGNPFGLGLIPIKPGSGGIPLPGVELEVVTMDDVPVPRGEKGILVIRRPFPSLTASLWGEPERYAEDYWTRIPGSYFTGDSVSMDADGYVWFAGRADEVINIASHRIGTVEVESAFLQHPAVAEAGVTGRPDEVRGETIAAFVVLRAGQVPSATLRAELLAIVRSELGAIAVVRDLNFVDMLPKTRSGKIMRRVLKAVTLGRDPGDITTIEDEGSVEDAREAWAQLRAGLGDR